MSTQTEITRLQAARNKIRTWLVGLGLDTTTDKLDTLATAVAAIKNQGAIESTIDGIDKTSVAIPAGHTSGGTVSLTNAIATALAAI